MAGKEANKAVSGLEHPSELGTTAARGARGSVVFANTIGEQPQYAGSESEEEGEMGEEVCLTPAYATSSGEMEFPMVGGGMTAGAPPAKGTDAYDGARASVDASKDDVKSRKAKNVDWMDFGSWLAGQQADDDVEGNQQEHRDLRTDGGELDAQVHVQSSTVPPATTSPVMAPKDCRMESNLLTSFGRQGSQEISVLLGATGIPASKCPVIPTKVVASVMTALYEPLVKLDVGVLTRAMESPMQLKPREQIGKGTLALYILPDDSLSLTFEGPLQGIDSHAQSTKGVMDIINMNLGLTSVRDFEVQEFQGTVWEELARFPRWREHSDTAVVTVHMLKGDKTGRSFYVLAGDDAAPPHFSLSIDSQRKFDDFSMLNSSSTATSANDAGVLKGRRHYFWMMGPNVEESIHALGKMKSYIKRPPTLSKIAGVPENILETVSDWIARVDELQREQAAYEGKDHVPANPLNHLGAVLGRRSPQMVVNQSIAGVTDAGDGPVGTPLGTAQAPTITVDSEVSVTANASAVFKDNRFNISCPCCLSVSWSVKSKIQVETPYGMAVNDEPDGDDGNVFGEFDALDSVPDFSSPSSPHGRDPAKKRIRLERDARVLKAAAMIATAEARCTSEVLARKAVEAIGKIRIEEWICEDFVRNTRRHRIRAKAERQRKKDLERGYAALQAAKPMIQRAVAKLMDDTGLDADMDGIDGADSIPGGQMNKADIGRPMVEPMVEPAVVGQDTVSDGTTGAGGPPPPGKKISISDLSKLF